MDVRITSLLEGASNATGVVVIVDVFRAFTTAAIGLDRGARHIIVVATVEEALELRRQGVADLCMGEVDGVKPQGFDFGNSPHELSGADVAGLVLVQSTRAGTAGVVAAGRASEIYLGSFVTATATAAAILRSGAPDVTIVAMGAQGMARTDEDELCALYLRNLLGGRHPDGGALRSLAMTSEEAEKYGDPARPHFHPRDLELALEIDRFDFCILVHSEGGLLIATKAS
jgi:2-phosphosulfolactate phosphatase